MDKMTLYFLCYIGFLLVMSITAFILYGADKRKAKKNKWRIKESVLLGFGFFGGAFGAIAGMKAFRHKTKHRYFTVINVLGAIWQTAAAVGLLYLMSKKS